MARLGKLSAQFLRGLGEAEPGPFIPSPFQTQALQEVLHRDTVVVAPTGSGKTWIAEQAIARLLERGARCWYTTPLKALSNQKYDNFRRLFGPDRVGILTGERHENAGAPLLVATTEILRNHLYSGEVDAALVVLDEAHYIGELERGVTWEEVIIFAPPRTKLLLLSATIANAEEIVGWMEEVRGSRPALIQVSSDQRPVPLRYGWMDRFGRPLPLSGMRNPWKARGLFHRGFDPVWTVEQLERHHLLPAIIFLPRRRDCDWAASRFRGVRVAGAHERERVYRELAQEFTILRTHHFSGVLIDAGVAPHHAGHLTAWKIAVERMLARGMVRAVFATTTLAAGLDVPARTVVLPTLWVGGPEGRRPLTALEFHQMTGRAGRRGKDKVGFVIVLPFSSRDLRLARELAESEPEELLSAFRVRYYQVLNLLAKHDLQEAVTVVDRSLALYQLSRRSRKQRRRLRRELIYQFRARAELLQELGYLSAEYEPTEQGEWALLVRHERSLLICEAIRRGLMDELDPEELAGWAGAMAAERSSRSALKGPDIRPLRNLARELDALERRYGIDPSAFGEPFRGGKRSPAVTAAAIASQWASTRMAWNELVNESGMEEGDLQRLILQTAEVLRELESLPLPLAEQAAHARLFMLREPVFDYGVETQR